MGGLREHLESSWSFYLTNTGGQIEFQEHLPLLVSGPSIFFVTFPLHRPLDEPYLMEYRCKDGHKKPFGKSTATLKEEILQILATISALDYTGEVTKTNVTVKPKVFIIGTHKDCLPEADVDRIIDVFDKELQKCIKSTSLHKYSIQFAQQAQRNQPAQLIFPVNNHSKYEGDFQAIRSAIQHTVEVKYPSEFTVKCPSSWLVFSLILRAKHKSTQVLDFEECFKVAVQCGISSHSEFRKALSFIHSKLGLLRYYEDVEDLNTHIVIDPQILFDTLTKLLYNKVAEVNASGDFYERGILPVTVVEKISEDSQFLSLKWLTNLLNYLRIAAFFTDPDDGVDKYFFPMAISRAPEPQSHQTSSSDIIPPLLVGFENGFCPRGIAGALIKFLMTNEMKSTYPWDLLPDEVFRNQVSFSIESFTGVIILKILPTHLEITVTLDTEDESMEICREVYTQIRTGMQSVTSQYVKCNFFFGFYCTSSGCRPAAKVAKQASSHIAKFEVAGTSRCTLRCPTTRKRGGPPAGYKVWGIVNKGKVSCCYFCTY